MKSSLAILFFAVCGGLMAEDAGSPSPNIPELKELNRFAGEWKANLDNGNLEISSSRTWAMDGYFLKHTYETSTGGFRGIIYRGYDKARHYYTLTFLDSSGNASLLTGDWNAELKTFIFEAVDQSVPIQRYESYFPDDKTEQWTIVYNNENRSLVSGRATKFSE